MLIAVTISAPARRGIFLILAAMAMASWLAMSYGFVAAQSGDGAGSYDEAEAQAIDRMLMCPVCPAQTIDQTEVPLAKQMRAQVREMLASGATRQEVLDWFAASERYGPGVLAEPPRSGFYLIAWIVPGVVTVAALLGGFLILRSMRRRPEDVANPYAHDPGDLQPYLDAVDRDLALDQLDGPGSPNHACNRPEGREERADG